MYWCCTEYWIIYKDYYRRNAYHCVPWFLIIVEMRLCMHSGRCPGRYSCTILQCLTICVFVCDLHGQWFTGPCLSFYCRINESLMRVEGRQRRVNVYEHIIQSRPTILEALTVWNSAMFCVPVLTFRLHRFIGSILA